jgi:hypothetical protein
MAGAMLEMLADPGRDRPGAASISELRAAYAPDVIGRRYLEVLEG